MFFNTFIILLYESTYVAPIMLALFSLPLPSYYSKLYAGSIIGSSLAASQATFKEFGPGGRSELWNLPDIIFIANQYVIRSTQYCCVGQ